MSTPATVVGVGASSLFEGVETTLEEINVPAYAIDTFGIVRWQNSAGLRLVGDFRGRQFTSAVEPEQSLEARETFARNVIGAQGVRRLLHALGAHSRLEAIAIAHRDGLLAS